MNFNEVNVSFIQCITLKQTHTHQSTYLWVGINVRNARNRTQMNYPCYLFIERRIDFCVIQFSLHGWNFWASRAHGQYNMFIRTGNWYRITWSNRQCHRSMAARRRGRRTRLRIIYTTNIKSNKALQTKEANIIWECIFRPVDVVAIASLWVLGCRGFIVGTQNVSFSDDTGLRFDERKLVESTVSTLYGMALFVKSASWLREECRIRFDH